MRRSCGNSQPSMQTFPIQRSTPKESKWLHGIYQKGLCLILALEVCAAVSFAFPVVHSINRPLNRQASGYRNRTSGGLNNVGSNGNWWAFAPNSQTNARNLNFNSGNVNPLNNNNRANGFGVWPVRASERHPDPFLEMKYTYRQIHKLTVQAYFKARKQERSTDAQLEFEMHLEENLKDLAIELCEGRWSPQPLDWFVNLEPTVREVFAPKFRDRIVSHVLFMLIAPIFERYFIADSFSCRIGKGTLVGIERFEHHLRSVTNNWQVEAYILNLDISGYFMSIIRGKLYDTIWETLGKHRERFPDEIDYDFADYLIFTFLSRDPLDGCVYYGDPGRIQLVMPEKSLRFQPDGVGIPIGDVINQLFSNIYLNPFDQFAKRELHLKNYLRYVDDVKAMHRSYAYMEECRERAGDFLREYGLRLHPNKTTITSTNGTAFFLGAAIEPYRRYAKNDSMERFYAYIRDLDAAIAAGKNIDPDKALSVMNSRLGYLSHFKEYRAIRSALEAAPHICGLFDFKADLTKAIIKTQQ